MSTMKLLCASLLFLVVMLPSGTVEAQDRADIITGLYASFTEGGISGSDVAV